MCGIFGATGNHDPSRLEAFARRLTRRGPDGFGSWTDPETPVYLAHCRLAIIDLSERGAQPMANEDGSVWLTFNGEIYNFKHLRGELEAAGHIFRSESDSEVIVHAYEQWGEECPSHLDGMFAFGVWDRRRRKLFLARDRLGIKPLYYRHFSDQLAFASEPKALLDFDSRRPDIHAPALYSYLLYRYVAGSESIWQGICRLLPAQTLTFDTTTSEVTLRTFWEATAAERSWGTSEAIDRLEELLESSVRSCLQSDVPVGVFLSGGYDSSLLAAVATSQVPHVNTFCIGFEDWARDERSLARRTAAALGTSHHEAEVGKANFQALKLAFDYFDEPLADTSILPSDLLCSAVSKQVKVAIAGDGGDELFAGYNWYADTAHGSQLKQFAFRFGPLLQSMGLGRTTLGRRSDQLEHFRLMTSPAFTVEEIHRLFPGLSNEGLPSRETYLYEQHLRGDIAGVKRWQALDIATFLPDSNLMYTDRVSMAHSLEVRVPYLDHKVVEFALSLPEDLCFRDGQKKYVLGQLLTKHGLDFLVGVPKRGFSCPIGAYWPSEDMMSFLKGGDLILGGLLDEAAFDDLIRRQESNRDLKLWILAVLEMWFRRWVSRSS